MAAICFISKPGTSSGPCWDCSHEDCFERRRDAKSRCWICHREIGFDTSFYREPEGRRHAGCEAPKAAG